MDYDFGQSEWLPDLFPTRMPGLRQAVNVVATSDGYYPCPSPQQTTLSLPAECYGLDRGRTQVGDSWVLGGTAKDLYLGKANVDFTLLGLADQFTLPETEKWDFDQYLNKVYATPGGTSAIQAVDIAAASMGAINGSASLAKVIMTFRDFLVLGNITGQGDNVGLGDLEAGLHWSPRGNPELPWPEVGTDPAIVVQSDAWTLEGDGGAIVDMIATAEWAIVLRERQTWRMDYVGLPDVFTFRLLDDNRGAIYPNAFGLKSLVYFMSEDGFMVCDGATVHPIGAEKIDRFTKEGLFDEKLSSWASSAHDPRSRSIIFSFPDFTTHRPTNHLCYHYELNKWTTRVRSLQRISTIFEGGTGSDMDDRVNGLGLTLMDTNSPTGVGDLQLDSFREVVEEELVMIGADNRVYTWNGFPSMVGFLTTGDLDLPIDDVHMLQGIRPIANMGVDGLIGCSISFRNLVDAEPDILSTSPRNSAGWQTIRVAGRYMFVNFALQSKDKNLENRMRGFSINARKVGSR